MDYAVFFEDSYGFRRIIGYANNNVTAWGIIHNFLKEHNYKPYYVREWNEPDGRHYDVGSHSEFFIWNVGDKTVEELYDSKCGGSNL